MMGRGIAWTVLLVALCGTPGIAAESNEVEPNDAPGQATALGDPTNGLLVQGSVLPAADVDYWAFTAQAGDRVSVTAITSWSAGNTDSQIEVLAADGTTVLEVDNDDGSFAGLSSVIAGLTLSAGGTYYVRVQSFSGTAGIRPYDLYVRLHRGSPVAETEPNGAVGVATLLPASGWASGTVDPAADTDFFSVTLAAGDTMYATLDLDPERDAATWNARLGFGLLGESVNQLVVVNDGSATSPNAEAIVMTVRDAGTYYLFVDADSSGGGATFSYHLSATVFPKATDTGLVTFDSIDVPKMIPTGPGQITSTLAVPSSVRIGSLRVRLQYDHASPIDVDIHLISPEGNTNVLLTDVGGASQPTEDFVLDDDAALPVGTFTILTRGRWRPELASRLGWFVGEDAAGTWTLVVDDDAAGDGGTLTGWGIDIVPAGPTCDPSATPVVIFSSDFETDDAGFTHSGMNDLWARGLPTAAPVDGCASGVACWKTNLTGTYGNNSSQDLLSPSIALPASGGALVARWAQRYQLESATFDHAFVEVREVGGADPRRLWEWRDATMTATVANPTVTLQESAGWGVMEADVSDYAGRTVELRFHLDSDSTIAPGGIAIDDVSVVDCVPPTTTTTSSTTSTTIVGSTTTTVASSTTTTTLAPTGGCTSEATYASVRCRLEEIDAALRADVPAGKVQAKLTGRLAKVRGFVDRAAQETGKKAAKFRRRAVAGLGKLAKLLAGKQASGAIEAAARQALRDAVGAVQGDLRGVSG